MVSMPPLNMLVNNIAYLTIPPNSLGEGWYFFESNDDLSHNKIMSDFIEKDLFNRVQIVCLDLLIPCSRYR